MSKVSVIMNCLNCENYVREAIDSVYAQTYPNWEIIFWDNASTDHSSEIAKRYGEKLRYFRGEKTISLYSARNKALKQAQGEFIAFLDCDDLWVPEKLEKQIPLFDDPELGLVFSDATYLLQNGRTGSLYSARPYHTGWCFGALLSDYFLCLQTVVIRRRALQTLKEWFDPRFNISGDADLFQRISYNWKLSMVYEPLAKYRLYSSSFASTRLKLLIYELPLMLQKYNDIFPEFESDYSGEIRDFRQKLDIRTALYHLDTGIRYKAITYLLPHVFSRPKAAALLVLAFLPKRVFDCVYASRHRIRFLSL